MPENRGIPGKGERVISTNGHCFKRFLTIILWSERIDGR